MKQIAVFALIALTALAGCATTERTRSGQRRIGQARQELSGSVPMRDFGYSIKELLFSPDSAKLLVIFTHTDPKTRPDWEFKLVRDEFNRYKGTSMQPFYTPGTANTPPVTITLNLPPS